MSHKNSDHSITGLSALQIALASKKCQQGSYPPLFEPIAVVGMSCRFPGNADSPEAYWRLLMEKRSGIVPTPQGRWLSDEYVSEQRDIPGTMYVRDGGFIGTDDQFSPQYFDADFFNISHRECASVDPQHRLLLETGWEALENAGMLPSKLKDSLTGVFVGIFGHDYMLNQLSQNKETIDAYMGIGAFHSLAAGRVSYFFGFQGPAIATDAACASSLVSIHQACQSLRAGECNMALAAGSHQILAPQFSISFCKAHMLAADGVCRAFDDKASGFVRGEGCAVVVLKRLSDAVTDGDRVLAVVRGSAVNQDGATSSLTVPNGPAQQSVIRRALANGGIDAKNVAYVEAHGTGTPIGDPIEFGALSAVYGKARETGQSPLYIGSAKTNIGHLEGAAGIAGFIKTVLSVQQGQIAPQINFDIPNQHIDWQNSHISVATTDMPWPNGYSSRIAAVSSFGLSGTNAHVIVEQAPDLSYIKNKTQVGKTKLEMPCLFAVSAKSKASLRQLMARYINYIECHPAVDVADLCFCANTTREQFKYRLCFEVASLDDLLERLTQAVALNCHETQARPSIVFDLSGHRLDTQKSKIELLLAASVIPQTVIADDITATSTYFRDDCNRPRIKIANSIELPKQSLVLELTESSNSLIKAAFEGGVDVQWEALGGYINHELPPLPNYSFDRSKHWYQQSAIPTASTHLDVNSPEPNISGGHTLHPLLDSHSQNGKWVRYSKVFSGRETYFNEHRVLGESVMPGMVAVEMAFSAIRHKLGIDKIIGLTDVHWCRALAAGDQPLNLAVNFNPFDVDAQNRIKIEVTEQLNSDREATVLIARVQINDASVTRTPGALDITEIRNRLTEVIDRPQIRHLLMCVGLNYQGTFSSLQRVYYGPDGVLGQFNLAQVDNFHSYNLHPGLLDSALQSLIGFQQAKDLSQTGGVSQILLPVGIGKLTLFRPLETEGFAYGTNANVAACEQFDGCYNFLITDNIGQVLARVDHLMVKLLSHDRFIETLGMHSHHQNSDVHFLRRQWQVELAPGKLHRVQWQTVILFTRNLSYAKTLAAVLPESEVLEIPVEKADDLMAWARRFLQTNQRPCAAIFCADFIDDDLTEFHALAELFKGQATAQGGRINRLCYLEESGKPSKAAVVGLFKALQKEDYQCCWQYLDVSRLSVDEDTLMDVVVQELAQPTFRFAVRYDSQQIRYVESFIRASAGSPREPAIANESVILISGGSGAVGLAVATHLMARYRAKVVLVGRSPATSQLLSQLDPLRESCEGKIEYRRCDVTDLPSVLQLSDEIRRRYGRIDVVIHSAAVTHDGLLLGKDKPALDAVIRTKCMGVWNLDQATQNDDLSLFASFSSLASVVGNEGQSDYCFANAYLDAFSLWRDAQVEQGLRRGKNLSINWPGWDLGENVGLGVSKNVAERLYLETGIGYLSSTEGLDAFEQAVNRFADHQILVLKGNEERFLNHVNQGREVNTASSTRFQYLDERYKLLLSSYVRSIFAEVLKIEKEQIEIKRSWDIYHMDSIMMLDVTHKLEIDFGPLPKTLLFEHKCIAELVDYLFDNFSDVIAKTFAPSEASASPRVCNESIDAKTSKCVETERSGDAVNNEEIAIIGVSGRYPDAEDLNAFWHNLANGHNAITEVPQSRWDHHDYSSDDKDAIGKTYAKWGGFINGHEQFDPLFFNISPKEARLMDPQERLWLQTAWSTIEDAGYTRDRLQQHFNAEVGVFVGVMWSEYQLHGVVSPNQMGQSLGSSHASIANRVSYWLDINGPSLAVDTMCSSSLVALHLACQSIRRGECRAALVGGVNLCLHPNKFVQMAQGRFASTDGRCSSFGAGGDGYVPGEGVGAVMLKPLKAAISDGDYIYGTIVGSSIGHGGKTHGFTVPSPVAQAKVIRQAIADAGVQVDDIDYIEAHGTGTSLGDPVEIKGIKDGYDTRTCDKPLYIGSVKSNIGHLEAAAGIAALTKVLLQFKHRQIAPSLHSRELNPAIDFHGSTLTVNQHLRDWPENSDRGMLAGISAFGAGGANAHIIVRAYQDHKLDQSHHELLLIPVSAMTEEQLHQQIDALKEFTRQHLDDERVSLSRVAYTMQLGREAMTCRRIFAVHNKMQLLDALTKNEQGPLPEKALQWQAGGKLDWAASYDQTLTVQPLPTYPFAKETYFYRAERVGTITDDPLVQRNISTLHEQAFYSRFNGSEYFFAHHEIGREKIMPGTVAIIMAIRATAKALPEKGASCRGVERVCFHSPIKVDEKGCRIVIVLTPRAEKVLFEIFSVGSINSQNRRLCVSGLVVPEVQTRRTTSVDIESIQSDMSEYDQDYYRHLANIGVKYGASFQLVKHIYVGDGQVLAHLLEKEEREEPALLDCALHIMGVLLAKQNDLQIPHKIKSLKYFGDVSAAKYVLGRRCEEGKFDIQLLDNEGVVLLHVNQLVCAAPNGAIVAVKAALPVQQLSNGNYQPVTEYIRSELAAILQLESSRIDSHTGWDKYGIDSVLIVNITEHFEKQFGELPRTLLFEYENLTRLVEYFVANHSQALNQLLGATGEGLRMPSATATVSEVRQPKNSNRFGGRTDIAVIGLSGRYAQAENLEQFWRNLSNGKDCISEIPRERWDGRKYYRKGDAPGFSSSIWGGFIDEVDKFDPLFFGIAPAEAQTIDPQERLFLEVAYETISDAGYCRQTLKEQGDVGVFVGVMYQEYQLYGAQNTLTGNATALSGSSASIANRVSYYFDFNGPSIAVDTMCSSSSTALQMAYQSIRDGRCYSALAGGVNLSIHPNKYLLLSGSHFLASDGRCRSFGEGGDGYVPGEGVGCVMLKRLDDAIKDNDHIYGVIKAVEINHGGRTNGYTVPNPNAQYDVIRRTLDSAGMDAGDISYVEAHGTGTPLGDPIEISALNRIFIDADIDDLHCAIGSVKSNIGHCESASGIAGLTKALLQMKYKQLVPSLHSQVLNTNINFTATSFNVMQQLDEWSHDEDKPRAALISSFGAGGSNSCILVCEHHSVTQRVDEAKSTRAQLVPISARTEEQLRQVMQRLLDAITARESPLIAMKTIPDSHQCQNQVAALVAETLDVAVEDIDPHIAVEEYGLDKTQRLLIHHRLCYELKIQLPAHWFVQSFSVAGLAAAIEHLMEPGGQEIEKAGLEQSMVPIPELADIAYTLQLGRDSFKHRIAFVVESLEELKLGLGQLLGQKSGSVKYYSSEHHGQSMEILSLFGADDLTTIVDKWLTARKLSNLARLWVSGQAIPWWQLHDEGGNTRRVSLPGYPFERRRIWYHSQDGFEITDEGSIPAGNTRLFPLVDQNLSSLYAQRYLSRFDVTHYLFADHQIQGVSILPAAGYIEVSLQALRLAGVEPKCGKNIMIMAPCTLAQGRAVVVTELVPDAKDSNCIHFMAKNEQTGNDAQIYCQGRWFLQHKTSSLSAPIDLNSVRQGGKTIVGEEFYRLFREKNFHYGEAFTTVNSARVNGDVALVDVQLPPSRQVDFAKYILHPSLVDAAFQSTMALFYQDEHNQAVSGRQFIPFSIAQMEIFRPLEQHVLVYVNNRRWINEKSGMLSFDIRLLDQQGQLLCQVDGFTIRAMSQGLMVQSSQKTVNQSLEAVMEFAAPVWLPLEPLITPEKHNNATICGEVLLAQECQHWLEPLKQAYPQYQFTLLPSLAAGEVDSGTDVLAIFMVLFEKIKAVTEDRSRTRSYIAVVVPVDVPGYRMLSGLLLSAHQEQPKLSAKLIEVQPGAALQRAIEIELSHEPQAVEQLCLNMVKSRMVREIKQWQVSPAELMTNASLPIQLSRSGGVYWITGGLGGIGQTIVSEMANTAQITIVLSGRSTLNDKLQSLLDTMRHGGKANIVYYTCDVADKAQITKTYQDIVAKFGQLNGIIHSAGVTNDAIITRKPVDGIAKVFKAKVNGAIELDWVSKDTRLDYFILFSSLASVNGNMGQSDYAAANAYIDAFALRRQEQVSRGDRSGLTISINWPLWRDGGMQLDPVMERWMLDKTGLVPITNAEGIAVLHRLLNWQQPLVAVFRQNENKAFKFLNIAPRQDIQASAGGEQVVRESTTVITEFGDDSLKQTIISLLAEVLKIESTDIDCDVELIEYGVDSIQMIALLNRFEQVFGMTMDPNTFVYHTTVSALAGHLAGQGLTLGQSDVAQSSAMQTPLSDTPLRMFLPQQHAPLTYSRPGSSGKIAVVAYAAKYPGARNADEFWHHLAAGTDLMSDVPASRWDIDIHYDPSKCDSTKSYAKRGGFIQGIEQFDAGHFGVSAVDAGVMDPQQRIILMQTQHLLDAAGYGVDELKGSNTGIFLGAKENNYLKKYQSLIPEQARKSILVHSLANMVAGRVADHYDLRGVVKTVDTACSSSLVAVHDACKSLLSGESEMAIAGGICLVMDEYLHVAFSQAGVLADDGYTRVFDQTANGFSLGEGVGLVMLKRLEDAERDGDQIKAVISGSAINNDGHTMGLTTPNQQAQTAVLEAAYRDAGVNPSSVSYLECHGTGTLLGDPIELKAAHQVYGNFSDQQRCAIGSVKSNIGHTMTAAGISSLLKVILSLQHRQLPPTLHCQNVHPRFNLDRTAFYINRALQPWQPLEGIRRAGVSSFGFGGTNVHLVIEEPSGEQQSLRCPLPVTRFNCQPYWLGYESFDDVLPELVQTPSHQGAGRSLAELLDALSENRISVDNALKMLEGHE